MSRRQSRGRRTDVRSRADAAYFNTIAGMRPRYWIDVEHTAISGGNVQSFTDVLVSGHAFPLAGSAVPAPAIAAGVMRNRPVASFAATNWYQSNAAAAQWNFMSDGTGATAIYVVRRTSVGNCLFHATQAGGARSTGFDWNYDGVSSNLALGNNASVNSVAIAINVDRCIAHTYDGVNGRTFSNGVQVATGAQAPFAGAVEAMSMGGDVNGQFTNAMYWATSIWFPRVLSAGELTLIASLMATRYGTT